MLLGGDGVQGRAGLVQQDHLGLDRQHPGDAQALLLAAGELQGGLPELVLDLVPEGRPLEAPLRQAVEVLLAPDAVHPQAVDHVLVDALGEGVGALEDHAHPPPQVDDVVAERSMTLAAVHASPAPPPGTLPPGRSCD